MSENYSYLLIVKIKGNIRSLRCKKRRNTENSNQIFPKELWGLSPNFHIHVYESDLYIPMIGVPILMQEICGPILGIYIYKSFTDI
jgi:hypothetical protein